MQAKTIPHTANIEITINNVRLMRDGRILRNVRSTGGLFPPNRKRMRKKIRVDYIEGLLLLSTG